MKADIDGRQTLMEGREREMKEREGKESTGRGGEVRGGEERKEGGEGRRGEGGRGEGGERERRRERGKGATYELPWDEFVTQALKKCPVR